MQEQVVEEADEGKNEETSLLFQRAAQGHIGRRLRVCFSYLNGNGVEKDENKALNDLACLYYDACAVDKFTDGTVDELRLIETVVPRSRLLIDHTVCISLTLSLPFQSWVL